MIPETFKAGVKSLGLSGHERMTPELQDRFFHDFLIKKAGGGDALGLYRRQAATTSTVL
jgi:hypothetical protein